MPRPETPKLTVDLVLRIHAATDSVVLIERRNPPHGWALPGGFVDLGETVADAARREGREEIGLRVTLVALLGVYSAPGRDPRGHTVSAVFVADAVGQPVAGDDAAAVRIHGLAELPPLVFDHGLILEDYRRWLVGGSVAPMSR
jgi:8-oxo-dGTP diphosphatase